MNIKAGILATVTAGAILMATSVAMASPGGHCDHMRMNPERMHEHMQARLDKLADRLEIKPSQQAAWEEFSKAVETLTEGGAKKPDDGADAAAIARYRAERATEFARKLTAIADATAKLQTVLTEDQKKILNRVSHRFLNMNHGWRRNKHGRGDADHEWDRRGSSGDRQHEHGNDSM
jgi:hypothetical protein